MGSIGQGLNLALRRHGKPSATAAFDPLSLSPAIALRSDQLTFQQSNGTTAAAADGDVVGYWGDRTANGRNAIQATTGSKPTLKLGVLDGFPAIRFDGTSSFLAYAGALGSSGSGALSLFLAVVPRVASGTPYLIQQGTFSAGQFRSIGLNGANWLWRMGSGNRSFTSGPTVGTPYLISAVVPAGTTCASYPLKSNGSALTQAGAVDASLAIADTVLSLGATSTGINRFQVDIVEVLAFTSALSATDESSVQGYFKSRYPSLGLP
jgi:hypothetical protein